MKKLNIFILSILGLAIIAAVVLGADNFVKNKKIIDSKQVSNNVSNEESNIKNNDTSELSTSTFTGVNQKGQCYIGGCSGQICGEVEGIVSDCVYKKEYSCYKDAKCERQQDGKCGWTETNELKVCLSDSSSI